MTPHEIAERINAVRAEQGLPAINARVVNGALVSDPVRATPTPAEIESLRRARAPAALKAAPRVETFRRRGRRRMSPERIAQRERIFEHLLATPKGATASEIVDALGGFSVEVAVTLLNSLRAAGRARYRLETRRVRGPKGCLRPMKVWTARAAGDAPTEAADPADEASATARPQRVERSETARGALPK